MDAFKLAPASVLARVLAAAGELHRACSAAVESERSAAPPLQSPMLSNEDEKPSGDEVWYEGFQGALHKIGKVLVDNWEKHICVGRL